MKIGFWNINRNPLIHEIKVDLVAKYVDSPKIGAVSLIVKFTENETKKIHFKVQDQSGFGSA